MSDNFISFDDTRKRVVEALKGAEIPVDRLYLVRNMFGRVRISAPERFEEDKACRKASEALALRVGEAAGPMDIRPTGRACCSSPTIC